MLRSVRIDLTTARRAFGRILEEYGRNPTASGISDDVISDVSIAVRFLRSALDKTANEVAKRHGNPTKKEQNRIYFPLASTESDFLGRMSPFRLGNDATDVFDAMRARQPYQAGLDVLRHLPTLYRREAHHDYNLQARGESRCCALILNGKTMFVTGPAGMSLGRFDPTVLTQSSVFTSADGQYVAIDATALDWKFLSIDASVLATLDTLCSVVAETCRVVSVAAGIAEAGQTHDDTMALLCSNDQFLNNSMKPPDGPFTVAMVGSVEPSPDSGLDPGAIAQLTTGSHYIKAIFDAEASSIEVDGRPVAPSDQPMMRVAPPGISMRGALAELLIVEGRLSPQDDARLLNYFSSNFGLG